VRGSSTKVGELPQLRQRCEEAAERYRRAAPQRQKIEQRRQIEGTSVVDSPEQVDLRVHRLARKGFLPPETLISAVPDKGGVERHVLFERIIAATNDLQAVNFLPRGGRASRSVARISMQRNGRLLPFGTGFLVSPRLLLTNNHVLPDVATATECVVEFNCEIDLDMATSTIVTYPLQPDHLFITNEHLDYSLVAVDQGPDGRSPGEEFGWNQLIAQQGKIVIGEPVNVVGHPMGRLKEIAIRNNTLQNQLDEFLHYTTDTEPGNSGSPVFNDQWEVVALHHSGVPEMDSDGNWLKKDGTQWRPGDDDALIKWIANEGVRVSVLLQDVHDQDVTEAKRGLLDEMGPQARPAVPLSTAGISPTTPDAAVRPEAIPSAPPKSGVSRSRPYGGDVELVFLHGRGQQGLNPDALRRSWTAGLVEGLTLAGLRPLSAAEAWFPFYGDALAEALVRERVPIESLDPMNAAEAMAPGEPSTRSVYEELIGEAAERSGLPPELAPTEDENFLGGLVGNLQKQLSWVAGRSGLDELLIAAIFKDVAAYLDHEPVRKLVLDAVMETIPSSGQIVLVSHSLGTVVGMDLITRLPREIEVVQLVTAGSPLGMDGVFKRLLSGGPHKPQEVGSWLNAWCAPDPVAIGCPLGDSWGPGIAEVITNNPKDRAHSIAEYLADARVARRIGSVLGAPTA
jgi:endonuclease G, mitochondrial